MDTSNNTIPTNDNQPTTSISSSTSASPQSKRFDNSAEPDNTVRITVTVKNRAVVFPADFDLETLRREEFQAELVLSETDFVKREAASKHSARLESINQLPNIDGEGLVLAWDFTVNNDSPEILIKYGSRIIWREPADYECADRFVAIAAILKQKYQRKLEDLVPTVISGLYLYGDDRSSIQKVKDARQSISNWNWLKNIFD